MADPLPLNSPILQGLERARLHMKDLERTLGDLQKRFASEGIPFALLGALAMGYHGYFRHTEDVDLLTTAEGLERIHERLVGRGLVLRTPGLRKGLRHTGYRVAVDIIQSGEHAGAKGSPYVYPPPDSDAFEERDGVRVPTLATLLTIKLVSGVWGKRLKDLGDVAELAKINRLDESFAERLIPEVRQKYLEILATTREEVDPETGL